MKSNDVTFVLLFHHLGWVCLFVFK